MSKEENKEQKVYTLEELKTKLTDKQRIFCHEYIVDWNATRSAKKAGYSEDTAYSIGNENLKKPEIQQYISFIKNNLEEEAGISKLKNLKTLAEIAFDESEESDNPRTRIEALKTINEMMGYKAPVKMEHKIEDLSHIEDVLNGIGE